MVFSFFGRLVMEENIQHLQLLSMSETKNDRAYRIDAGKLSLRFWCKKRIFRVNVLPKHLLKMHLRNMYLLDVFTYPGIWMMLKINCPKPLQETILVSHILRAYCIPKQKHSCIFWIYHFETGYPIFFDISFYYRNQL